jgi:hypothetical protein
MAGPRQIWARSAQPARRPARVGAESVWRLGRPIRTRSTAERRRPRWSLHAHERAAPARVLAGERLTEVTEARRGWEMAAVRPSMTRAST